MRSAASDVIYSLYPAAAWLSRDVVNIFNYRVDKEAKVIQYPALSMIE